jgi:CBS domain-containing protein
LEFLLTALEILVDKRITGMPVVDENWTLVGVVSDYDLLALDSISDYKSFMFVDKDSFGGGI